MAQTVGTPRFLIRIEPAIDTQEVIDLLKRSTLAERRPISTLQTYTTALRNSSLIISARDTWDNHKLIGYARCLTDFATTCYVADLAVDKTIQRQGIGRKLLDYIEKVIEGEHMLFMLLAAPKAIGYYPKVGYQPYDRCFIRKPGLVQVVRSNL